MHFWILFNFIRSIIVIFLIMKIIFCIFSHFFFKNRTMHDKGKLILVINEETKIVRVVVSVKTTGAKIEIWTSENLFFVFFSVNRFSEQNHILSRFAHMTQPLTKFNPIHDGLNRILWRFWKQYECVQMKLSENWIL